MYMRDMIRKNAGQDQEHIISSCFVPDERKTSFDAWNLPQL